MLYSTAKLCGMVKGTGEWGRAGKIEWDGRRMIGALTANKTKDENALLSIKEQIEDVPNVPKFTTTRPLQHPPLPAPSLSNIVLSCAAQLTYT